MLLAGLGLIVLGMAGLFVLADLQQDETLLPTDFSAIPVAVHYEAPTLALNGLDGIQHALSDYAGHVVLVNLWATWCPPCKAEMPILQDFFEKHRNEGFIVLGIEDGDPIADVNSFVSQYSLTFPIWLDPSHQATERGFKTNNLPSSYLVDRAGEVRLAWFGAISVANLEKYITPIIKER